jgi:hypothetical protein
MQANRFLESNDQMIILSRWTADCPEVDLIIPEADRYRCSQPEVRLREAFGFSTSQSEDNRQLRVKTGDRFRLAIATPIDEDCLSQAAEFPSASSGSASPESACAESAFPGSASRGARKIRGYW